MVAELTLIGEDLPTGWTLHGSSSVGVRDGWSILEKECFIKGGTI
jgi:hypothetical protein